MKAYLKYGRFTTFMDMPRLMQSIVVPKPPVVELAKTNYIADVTKLTKLEFQYINSQTIAGEEVAIYEFKGEV